MAWLVTAGKVLPGPAGECIADGAVLVVGDSIAAVGERDKVEAIAPAGAIRADFPGGTALPGLIDSHVHLSFDPAKEQIHTVAEDSDDAGLVLAMAGRARQLLASGVTTVRDLGDWHRLTLGLRDAIQAGHVLGPRILAATTPLTTRGGHCSFLGGEVDDEEAMRALVRANAAAGADLIKVMVTGGHLTPSGPTMWDLQFTEGQLEAVVEEAHARGLPVAAHAHATAGIAAAAQAGVDTIEHCTWLGRDEIFEVPAHTVAQIRDQGITVSPAVSRNWRGFGNRFGEEIAEQLVQRLHWFDEQGLQLAVGTDAGIPGALFGDYVGGLEAFQHTGMTTARIIELATSGTASALRLANTTGRLREGLSADVLVVAGDPLDDLGALREVRLVLTQGQPCLP